MRFTSSTCFEMVKSESAAGSLVIDGCISRLFLEGVSGLSEGDSGWPGR
jgi:hypothetical protein